jgi:hypothetical protein
MTEATTAPYTAPYIRVETGTPQGSVIQAVPMGTIPISVTTGKPKRRRHIAGEDKKESPQQIIMTSPSPAPTPPDRSGGAGRRKGPAGNISGQLLQFGESFNLAFLKLLGDNIKSGQSMPLNGLLGNIMLWDMADKVGVVHHAVANVVINQSLNILGIDVQSRDLALINSIEDIVPILGALVTRPPPDLLLTATLTVKADTDTYNRPFTGPQAMEAANQIGESFQTTLDAAWSKLSGLIEKGAVVGALA